MNFYLSLLIFFVPGFIYAEDFGIERIWISHSTASIEAKKVKDHYLLLEGIEDLATNNWNVLDAYLPSPLDDSGNYTFNQPLTHKSYYYRVRKIPVEQSKQFNSDGDHYSDYDEITHPEFLKIGYKNYLPPTSGRRIVNRWIDFESELSINLNRGAFGSPVLRFVIVGIETSNPILFIVGKKFGHGTFVNSELDYRFEPDTDFQKLAYGPLETRHFLTGYIAYHENYVSPDGKKGALAYQYWPGDLPPFDWVQLTDQLMKKTLAFPDAKDRIFYFPASLEQHRKVIGEEKELFAASEIKVLDAEELFSASDYQPYLLGRAVGKLVKGTSGQERYGRHDVVVFESIPKDLNRVAGIITQSFQTPLSHVALRAQQDSIPNAMVANAIHDPTIQSLWGQWVVYTVTSDGYSIREATDQEVEMELMAQPPTIKVPDADLTYKNIDRIENIVFSTGVKIFGAKATNLGELRDMKRQGLLVSEVPDGRAIPFYYYDAFMRENNIYSDIQYYMSVPEFQANSEYRNLALEQIRNKIENGIVSQELITKLDAMVGSFPAQTVLRFRSSTNNEDLNEFSGAGLYDSYTHHIGEPKPSGGFYRNEGHVSKTVKQVWASLWNFRAFEERESYGINHFKIYMGVLVHPNFDLENVNGVAATFDPYDGGTMTTYVNAMPGEELVTGAEAAQRLDEFLVSPNDSARSIDPTKPYGIAVRQFASDDKKLLMSDNLIIQVHKDLFRAKLHMGVQYRSVDPFMPLPLVEVEFKQVGTGANAKIWIKQIRPYLGR